MNANDIHFVRVTTDDRTYRLWAAATPSEQAVDRVLDAIPEGWSACLTNSAQTALFASVNLDVGEVRELENAGDWQFVGDELAT